MCVSLSVTQTGMSCLCQMQEIKSQFKSHYWNMRQPASVGLSLFLSLSLSLSLHVCVCVCHLAVAHAVTSCVSASRLMGVWECSQKWSHKYLSLAQGGLGGSRPDSTPTNLLIPANSAPCITLPGPCSMHHTTSALLHASYYQCLVSSQTYI